MKDRVSLSDFLMYHKETHPISFHMLEKRTLYGIYGFGDFVKERRGNDITRKFLELMRCSSHEKELRILWKAPNLWINIQAPCKW